MSNNIIVRLSKVIDHIEENIKEIKSLDEISCQSGISKYHLLKIFKAATGNGLMEYVKKRKLTHSLNELINTDLNIIDIAYEYNFTYEQSYIRLFKKTFGISPNRVRKDGIAIEVTEKFNVRDIIPIGQDWISIKPVVIIKPSFSAIGIKHKIYFIDNWVNHIVNKVGVDFYFSHKHKVKNAKNYEEYLGIAQYFEGVTDYKTYMPCLEVTNITEIPEGMSVINVPTYKYAVFRYISLSKPSDCSYELIKDQVIPINNWLKNSNYKMAGYFVLERGGFNKGGYIDFDLMIPITNKLIPTDPSLLIPLQHEVFVDNTMIQENKTDC